MSDEQQEREAPMVGPLVPAAEDWQRAMDALRVKLAPVAAEMQRICTLFYGGYSDAVHDVQRQRITAAKRRARIVTRAKAKGGK